MILKIRPEQMEALEKHSAQRLFGRIAGRLSDEFEAARDLEERALLDIVRGGCEDAAELAIVREDDIYRYIRLKFVIADRPVTPLLAAAILGTISKTDTDASRRLDFIETNVLPRIAGG